MGNRNMGDREAIQHDLVAEEAGKEEAGDFAKKVDFKSTFVKEVVGVPKGLDVFKAVDSWANAWGQLRGIEISEESLETRREEVSSSDRGPAAIAQDDSLKEKQKTAGEKVATAERALSELLPNANFGIGVVTFEGGHIQLSA